MNIIPIFVNYVYPSVVSYWKENLSCCELEEPKTFLGDSKADYVGGQVWHQYLVSIFGKNIWHQYLVNPNMIM